MENNRSGKYNETVLDGVLYAEMVRSGAACLRANAAEVNDLNVFPVPDGDTGDNMSMTVEGGSGALAGVEITALGDVAQKAARGMLLGARGNSGVILSQMFAGMAQVFDGHSTADTALFSEALKAGVKKAYSAVMNPTEGTMLTVLREGVEAVCAEVNDESTVGTIVEGLLTAMVASLERTPEMLPVLREAGVVDSGGAGVVFIVNGFLSAVLGEEITLPEGVTAAPSPKTEIDFSAFTENSVMTYGYCTELLLQLQNSKCDPETFEPETVTDFLKTVGDSIVAFKTGTIIKIHVHTLTPERVLEFCRRYGEFLTVKIENMSVQHNELSAGVKPEEPARQEHKKFAFVTVASGEGMGAIFRDMGADYIVDGGQTNNPSTSDFLAAFDYVNADYIYVLPNNGNIILAAQQAAEVYEGSKVFVIPSRDIGSGYVALSTLDLSVDDPEALAISMTSSMADVDTGLVSPAIRDTTLNGVDIKDGDFIGFVGKKMIISTPELVKTACGLCDSMLEDGEKFMLTVFCGKDASEAACAEIESYVGEVYPDVEVYSADGGQDVYPFIFVAE